MLNKEANMQNGSAVEKVRKSKLVRGKMVYWVGDRKRPFRQKKSDLQRFNEKVIKGNGCWGWKGSTSNYGYGKMWFQRKVVNAHRISWMIFRGDPGNSFILHRCDNPLCSNPEHLFLGTQQDNLMDMHNKKRHRVKFVDAQIIKMRNLKGKVKASEVAKTYKISVTYLYKIWNNVHRKTAGG